MEPAAVSVFSDLCLRFEDAGAIGSHGSPERNVIVSGTVLLPTINGPSRIPVQGVLPGIADQNGAPIVSSGFFRHALLDFDFAAGIKATDVELQLIVKNGIIEVRLRGKMRIEIPGRATITGAIDAPLFADTRDPCSVAIKTFLIDARFETQEGWCLAGGTVLFVFSSSANASDLIARIELNEDDDLLFQTEQAITLGVAKIRGIASQPITLGIQCNCIKENELVCTIEVFPALILFPCFGPDTMLFMHGETYDQPGFICINGPWSNSVSSNVRLHLCAKNLDGTQRTLVQGTAALSGMIHGTGLAFECLELEALLSNGLLFPESDAPVQIPEQPVRIRVEHSGHVSLQLAFREIRIRDFTVVPREDAESHFTVAVTENGISVDFARIIRADGSFRLIQGAALDRLE